jgi:hypothetical protein
MLPYPVESGRAPVRISGVTDRATLARPGTAGWCPGRQAVAGASRDDRDGALLDFYYELDRGQACYIVTYHEGQPADVLFAGRSVD